MAEEDELYYLQPGFDPNTLTVPKIRSILVTHDIPYPSGAKKGQLLEVMEQDLLPQAKKLLKAQARVRRTSKGIQDVPSSQEATVDGDEEADKQTMPPPKTPRSRKSKADLSVDPGSVVPSTTRRTKTPSRRSTTRTPRVSDTEPEIERTVRTSRKSVPRPILEPSVRIDEPDARMKRESLEAGTSPFSDENPFQSGSSPPSGADRRKSASRSRKSLAATSTKKSPTKRRETRSPTIKSEEFEPSRSSYSFPLSKVTSDETEDNVPVTEEFTPDAARELAEQERNGQVVQSRPSTLVRRKKQKPAGTIAKTAPWAVMTTVLAALAGWYRHEKINVGYCGVGQPHWSLAENPHIPAWVHQSWEPACEPCPQHAICYPNMDVQCETDFVLQPHPLSMNGLLPLPPTCEPDSEKERRIKAVADRAVEELRERRAAYECGDKITKTEEAVSTAAAEVKTVAKSTVSTKLQVSDEDLKKSVSKLRRKGMTEDEFEDLWRGALGDIMGREEVEVTHDKSGRLVLSSTSLARLPFGCAVRRSLVRTLSQNRIPIGILILVLSSMAYGRYKLVAYKQATAQIPGLVATTLDRLATQAALNQDGRSAEPFISVGQLRDDVLRHVFSASERERVWQNVRKIVETNSNVRAATREGGKTGEWSRVWEWIGPVDLAPALEGRRSGGLIEGGGSRAERSLEGTPDRSNLEVRRWDEGRPIY
ncbi:inner nuclear membrane protein enriched at telomere/subtelomere region [Exophiala xenobiotica]